MVQANPERFRLYQPISDPVSPFLGMICITINLAIFYQATNQMMAQRLLGARSQWDASLGTIFAGCINFLRPLVTVFLGFIVYHWIHVMGKAEPLENPDYAFGFALRNFAGEWGMRGVICTGFLAAIMSTLSSLSVSMSTIFALDVYKKVSKQTKDKTIVRVGQLAGALGLILAALIAPIVEHFGGIFQYFYTAITYLATPFATVIFLGMIWKRMNYAGALFGIIGGFCITILLVTGLWLAEIKLHWAYVGVITQAITALGIVIVSLRTKAPDQSQWEPFHWSRALLRGDSRPWYKSLKIWWAVYALVWVYLYWRFW